MFPPSQHGMHSGPIILSCSHQVGRHGTVTSSLSSDIFNEGACCVSLKVKEEVAAGLAAAPQHAAVFLPLASTTAGKPPPGAAAPLARVQNLPPGLLQEPAPRGGPSEAQATPARPPSVQASASASAASGGVWRLRGSAAVATGRPPTPDEVRQDVVGRRRELPPCWRPAAVCHFPSCASLAPPLRAGTQHTRHACSFTCPCTLLSASLTGAGRRRCRHLVVPPTLRHHVTAPSAACFVHRSWSGRPAMRSGSP